MHNSSKGWIGWDLDGTLAVLESPYDPFVIGRPIVKNVDKLKSQIDQGYDCRIFTARVDGGLIYSTVRPGTDPVVVEVYRQVKLITTMIQDWCEKEIGCRMLVTCQKDAGMLALYDDKCIQVEHNTGNIIGYDYITLEDGIIAKIWSLGNQLDKEQRIKAGMIEELKLAEQRIDYLRRELSTHREKAIGNYWAWQGNQTDHLESLASSAPVLIQAGDLRELIKNAT